MSYVQESWRRDGKVIRNTEGFGVGVAYDSGVKGDGTSGLMLWNLSTVIDHANMMAAGPELLQIIIGMNQGPEGDWCMCPGAVDHETDHQPDCRRAREVLARLDPGLVTRVIEGPENEDDDDYWESSYYDD